MMHNVTIVCKLYSLHIFKNPQQSQVSKTIYKKANSEGVLIFTNGPFLMNSIMVGPEIQHKAGVCQNGKSK